MQHSSLRILLAVLTVMFFGLRAPAQDEPDPKRAALKARFEKFLEMMQAGPTTGQLGSVAKIEIPADFAFTGKSGTTTWLELNENIPSGGEVGLVAPKDLTWVVVFEYEATGHVKDGDKDDLDADKLLDTIQESTKAVNEDRKQRGWSSVEVVGWHKKPFYDPATHNLTWSTRVRSDGGESINWSTRMLGRSGTVDVSLIASPANIDAAVPAFNGLLKGFTYIPGQTYGEFKPGVDKVAEYGLAALVAGGAGVLAAKTGLFAKFWKLIMIAIAGIGAFFKKLFGFGKKSEPDQSAT